MRCKQCTKCRSFFAKSSMSLSITVRAIGFSKGATQGIHRLNFGSIPHPKCMNLNDKLTASKVRSVDNSYQVWNRSRHFLFDFMTLFSCLMRWCQQCCNLHLNHMRPALHSATIGSLALRLKGLCRKRFTRHALMRILTVCLLTRRNRSWRV